MEQKIRDMTQKQFDNYTKKFGFRQVGFMGYYDLPAPNSGISVSKYNAGNNRRAQLAYLLAQAKLADKEKTAQSQLAGGLLKKHNQTGEDK